MYHTPCVQFQSGVTCIAGRQQAVVLFLIIVRTLMNVPRPGSVMLAAAASKAAMEGWPEPTGTIVHAIVTFISTDVLLALFMTSYVLRLDSEVSKPHLLRCELL